MLVNTILYEPTLFSLQLIFFVNPKVSHRKPFPNGIVTRNTRRKKNQEMFAIFLLPKSSGQKQTYKYWIAINMVLMKITGLDGQQSVGKWLGGPLQKSTQICFTQ